jgi:hypothetical protein
MKDSQVKKLTRVVRKLAAEVAALRKLVRRELSAKRGNGKARKGKKARKKDAEATDPTPPAA